MSIHTGIGPLSTGEFVFLVTHAWHESDPREGSYRVLRHAVVLAKSGTEASDTARVALPPRERAKAREAVAVVVDLSLPIHLTPLAPLLFRAARDPVPVLRAPGVTGNYRLALCLLEAP